MKDIKDYIHLYIGCEVIWTRHPEQPPKKAKLVCYNTDGNCVVETKDSQFITDLDKIKPILRRLSSMTEEERAELWSVVFGNNHRKFTGSTKWFDKPSLSSDPRWVLLQGVERLGIEMNGHVWADSDLHLFKHNQHEVTRWLLSKGFDLFGLIDSNLAIDSSTITENK